VLFLRTKDTRVETETLHGDRDPAKKMSHEHVSMGVGYRAGSENEGKNRTVASKEEKHWKRSPERTRKGSDARDSRSYTS